MNPIFQKELDAFDKIPHGKPANFNGDYVTMANAKSFLLASLQRASLAVVEKATRLDGRDTKIGGLYLNETFRQGHQQANKDTLATAREIIGVKE